MKILNLYAGIGGNRKLWPSVHEVTAVEINPEIAKIYQDFFPNDKVIVGDAHQYLLEHYKEFDFIWSSPPCQTHSITNNFLNAQGVVRYPDISLYQEIIFLRHFCRDKFVIENVKPYYPALIKPTIIIGRHYFWANFKINGWQGKLDKVGRFGPTKKGRTDEKVQSKRNMVGNEIGLHILNEAFKSRQEILRV